jgi:hypothetical protein
LTPHAAASNRDPPHTIGAPGMNRILSLTKVAGAAGLIAAGAAMHGCNVLGPIAYIVHGPGKVNAVHTLDPQKATVVFVDDVNSRLPSRAVRGEIAASAEKYLLREDCLTDVIDYRAAMQASSSDRTGISLSIVEIGQAVKAEVLIYIVVEDFGLSPDGQTYSPFAYARVKVMDVKSNKRIWPADERGHQVRLSPNPQATQAPATVGARLESSRLLGAELGKAVAQLFYTHEGTNSAGKEGPFND